MVDLFASRSTLFDPASFEVCHDAGCYGGSTGFRDNVLGKGTPDEYAQIGCYELHPSGTKRVAAIRRLPRPCAFEPSGVVDRDGLRLELPFALEISAA